jgi:hypothetical protein
VFQTCRIYKEANKSNFIKDYFAKIIEAKMFLLFALFLVSAVFVADADALGCSPPRPQACDKAGQYCCASNNTCCQYHTGRVKFIL